MIANRDSSRRSKTLSGGRHIGENNLSIPFDGHRAIIVGGILTRRKSDFRHFDHCMGTIEGIGHNRANQADPGQSG